VLTASGFSKETIIGHHGLPDYKVIVAYHGIDSRFDRSEQIGRPPAASLQGDFVFYPANLWRHKNHQVLLQALRILNEKGLAIHAVFTGSCEPNGSLLTELVAQYALADQVHHLGFVSVEELAYLYRKARFLVFPSLFEGFGMPLVEAMAAGC